MKKQLNKMLRGNKGFFLPYTIWITMLVLLNVTTMITIYEHRIVMNETTNELVEIETLVQMTREAFYQDKMYEDKNTGETTYHHPNGKATLTFEWLDEVSIEAEVEIETLKGTHVDRRFRLFFTEDGDAAKEAG